jgi:hypothetical protein
MKFLLISGIYPPDIGGPAIFIPKLAEFLHNKGHECEVLTLKNHKIQKLNQNELRYLKILTL